MGQTDWKRAQAPPYKIQLMKKSLLLPIFTLTLLTSAMGQTSPTIPAKADSAAYALLKAAHDARQVVPATFPGFTATILFRNGTQSATGTLRSVKAGKTTFEVTGLGADDKSWLEDQVLSMMGHRHGGDFAKGDGSNPITFGKLPDNSFGKLIELNDGMGSSYRVMNNKIMEVTRTGGSSRFTVSVLQTQEEAGKYLPVHFIVAYHDEKTGALQKVEGYRDAYAKIDGYWLPASRLVVAFGTADSAELRQIVFKDFKLN